MFKSAKPQNALMIALDSKKTEQSDFFIRMADFRMSFPNIILGIERDQFSICTDPQQTFGFHEKAMNKVALQFRNASHPGGFTFR